MSSIKILITDPISETGMELFTEEGMKILYKPDSSMDEINNLVHDVDAWIVRSGTQIKEESIKDAKKLQIIGRAGVGIDNIDIDCATQNGIVVMNVPDGNTISAAEHTMAMMFALSRNIVSGHTSLMDGKWKRSQLIGNELQNKKMGVIGLGKIGREVIKRCLSFDMEIIGYDPYINQDSFSNEKIKVVDFDTLIKDADYITLHLPINDSTRNLFTIKEFKIMKQTAKIINVARGGIINEKDLCDALDKGFISGAAIDVFEEEPLSKSSPLIDCKNILLTPHLGASTFEAKEGVTLSICNQIIKYFKDNQLSNAINIPISDISLINKLRSYYKLSELMGLIQSQLAIWPVSSVKVICYGTAEDSKSIGLAVLKGLLSNITDNRINFINAATIAKERSISFSHIYSNENTPYLNVIEVQVESENQKITLSGSVFSENHIRIINIMGFEVDLRPVGKMLFIKNKDVPGVIGKIGTILGQMDINISGYLLSKMDNKNYAYSIIRIDNEADELAINKISQLSEIQEIKQLNL